MKLRHELSKLRSGSIIMISGFGGSGKSTLAEELNKTVNGMVISIDDFYTDMEEYHNWDNYEYQRFIKEVLLPYKNEQTINYKAYNWENDDVLVKKYPYKEYLIIEGVGLFREEVYQLVDYSIWIDCDIETAVLSGKKRDRDIYHVDFDEMWDTIWKQNDLECFALTKPLQKADYILKCPCKNS